MQGPKAGCAACRALRGRVQCLRCSGCSPRRPRTPGRARGAEAPARTAQVWRHESAKIWQALVSLTACMVSSILARPDELNMKSPVAVTGCRAWFFLGERYRLTVLLRLHAISMVRPQSLSPQPCQISPTFQGKRHRRYQTASPAVPLLR